MLVARIALSCLMLAAPARSKPSAPASPPTAEDTNATRRAVRGAPIDDGIVSESPELREVRRFEKQAFPQSDDAPVTAPDPDETPQPLPPALRGRWSGTGDIPAQLRTPETARAGSREPPAPDAAWLRSLTLPELPVRWEPQVLRYLEFFKNDRRGRAIMASWLRRLGRYRAPFEKVLEREQVPKDLVFLAMIESGFEPGAISRAGAGGVWQFMPGSARAYGLEVSYWVDDRRDPERAAEAAARYLKDLHVRFGSWPLAFAAYNAGYGAILKSIARYNTNDFWELGRHEAGLPWESTLYVPKIMAAAIIGHNIEAFGFAGVAPDPPLAQEQVQVASGTTLAAVARAAGVGVETIAELNPRFIRARVPPDRAMVAVRVPPGTAAAYAAAIENVRGGADKVENIVLRFGETLDDVAQARGISLQALRKLNQVTDSVELRGGATIVVPLAREPVVAEGGGAVAVDDTILVALPDRTFTYEGRERVFYRTRDGDTLEEIADVFSVQVDDLVEWNNLDAEAAIHPKMVLQIFARKDFDRAGVLLLDPANLRVVTLGSEEFLQLQAARNGKTRLSYTARAGDTLAKIARRYGLSPGDLARINRLSYSSDLADGQKVIVYSPTPQMPREIASGRNVRHTKPAAKPVTATPAPKAKIAAANPRPVAMPAPLARKTATKPGAAKK